MEIKRQITGMMRLLSDKAGRGYQRVEREGEAVKEEPQEEALSWALPQNQATEEPQQCWRSAPTMPQSQYDTRSKTQKMLNSSSSKSESLWCMNTFQLYCLYILVNKVFPSSFLLMVFR